MRIVSRHFEKDGSGRIVCYIEDVDDLWFVYNIVAQGDTVKASTHRKVQQTTSSGSVFSEVHRTNVVLNVKALDFDQDGGTLRISGTVEEQNPYIQRGHYHTVTLQVAAKLELFKPYWDFIAREKLAEAADVSRSADLAIILVDMGRANVYLMSRSLVKNVSCIEEHVPKRRALSNQHQNARDKFFERVFEVILKRINFDVVQCVVLAGPGFVKDDLFKWMLEKAESRTPGLIHAHRKRFLLCKASSAFRHSLAEVIDDPTVKAHILHTKASSNASALERFYSVLHKSPSCACYGPHHVRFAAEQRAIKELLLTDRLFRSAHPETRKSYAKMAETVARHKGKVFILSDSHVAGEQLQNLGGIAAILHYGLPELDELEVEHYM